MQQVINEGTDEVLTEGPKQSEQIGDTGASTSQQKPEAMKYEPGNDTLRMQIL